MRLDPQKRSENDGHETAETTGALLNAPYPREEHGLGISAESEFLVPWLNDQGEMQMIRAYLY